MGYKLAAEAFGPAELVRQAVLAEQAGFDFVEISDHYHPWLDNQGHSPFAWTVLGSIAAKTSRIELATGVTCPTVRYHPAIIAQAAATLALLSEGRFVLGVGSGERLNEHVVGRGFPDAVRTRHEMLKEALEIIRLLWSGGTVPTKGNTCGWRTPGFSTFRKNFPDRGGRQRPGVHTHRRGTGRRPVRDRGQAGDRPAVP